MLGYPSMQHLVSKAPPPTPPLYKSDTQLPHPKEAIVRNDLLRPSFYER